MSDLMTGIRENLEKHNYKYRTVDIARVPELLETIHKLEREGAFDKQVAGGYIRYYTDISNQPPDAKTLCIIAMPSPITRADFVLQGGVLPTIIPPQYIGGEDSRNASQALKSVLEPAGYKVNRATLPFKTLAARSGLAEYGRNNLTYVKGMGSFLRLAAFYTDMPCDDDNWGDAKLMAACENCIRCRTNCPTECIAADRFQVHAERCLTFLNERDGDFPDWVKPEWHNALIGCMRCQDVCPVDKPYTGDVKMGPVFDAAETGLILNKTPFKELPEPTQQKLRDIAYDDTWLYRFLARNLGALVKK